jgi:carbon monoxide dehydrogenase subunit G
MVSAESSIVIARPAAEVFEFVSDLRNDPRWHTDILEAQLTGGGSIGPGSVFAIKFKPFMGHSEGTVTVSEYSPPQRTVLQGKMGKMAPTITLTVKPEGAGARFTRRVDMQPPGLMRVMAPLMGGMFRKQNAGFVANLKRVLEET